MIMDVLIYKCNKEANIRAAVHLALVSGGKTGIEHLICSGVRDSYDGGFDLRSNEVLFVPVGAAPEGRPYP